MLISFSVMIVEVYKVVDTFSTNEKWSTTVSEVHEKEVPFPVITICNYNRISKRRAEEYQMNNDVAATFFGYIVNSYPLGTLIGSSDLDLYSKWRQMQNLTYTSVLEKMGMDCAETFIRYRHPGSGRLYAGESFCNGSHEHTVRPIITAEFGKCYQINALTNVTKPGRYRSWRVAIPTKGTPKSDFWECYL